MSHPFHQVELIFHQAVEWDGPARESYLDRVCAGDLTLRQEVNALLAADAEVSDLGMRLVACPTGSARTLPSPENYRLIRRLGEGGMGTVYLAEGVDALGRPARFAVKVLRHPMEGRGRRRFELEQRVLTHLDHPYIVRLRGTGELPDGSPFLVMDYVEGQAIDAYCQDRRASIDERLLLVERVCTAVAAAHRQRIVHRDLKPSNILVQSDGTPKLLDFGIAKVLEPVTEAQTSGRLLTPEFASPEQLLARVVTPASDVYSLGVLMYRLLTGRSPYDCRENGALEALLTGQEPKRPSDIVTERAEETESESGLMPKALGRRLRGDPDDITLKALRRHPGERYRDADALRQDLERYRTSRPVHARRASPAYVLAKALRRHRKVAAGTLAAALVAMVTWDLVTTKRQLVRLEEDSLDLLASSDPMAEVLFWKEERYEEAEELLRKTLRIQSYTDASTNDKARLQIKLGDLYHSWGRLDEALRHNRRALHILEAGADPDPALLGDAFNNLGLVLMEKGELDEALEWTGKAYELRLGHLGQDHVDFVQSTTHMMMVHAYRQEFDKSLVWGIRALEAGQRVLGSDHVRLAHILSSLGRLRMQFDPVELCEAPLRRALHLRRTHLGPDHWETSLVEARLGLCLVASGRSEEAAAHLDHGLTTLEAKRGPDGPAAEMRRELAALEGRSP